MLDNDRYRKQQPKAFTLIELMIVIFIIALLASMLAPAVSKARQAANTLACLANLRSLGQAMMIYTMENRGFIPGSSNTTARYFYDDDFDLVVSNDSVPPPCIQLHDYIGPLAPVMGLPVPETTDLVVRFDAYRKLKVFICPTNKGVMAAKWAHSPRDAGVGQMISYATSLNLMLTPCHPAPGVTRKTRMSSGPGWWRHPDGYYPNIQRLGRPAEKIFLADAAKWSGSSTAPDYNLNVDPFDGGAYSDFGPFSNQTESYDRTAANGGNAQWDGRMWAYRHGTGRSGATGAWRINVVFFDGHAETLTDMESCNPNLWLPSGSTIDSNAKIWPDVQRAYHLENVSPEQPYVVP